MNQLQSQMYGHAPSPCPVCSDPALRPAVREEQQGTLDHFKVGDRVRTTAQHRRLNYEDSFYAHPGTVLKADAITGPLGPMLRILWDAFEFNGHTIPAREGLARPGNLEHVESTR